MAEPAQARPVHESPFQRYGDKLLPTIGNAFSRELTIEASPRDWLFTGIIPIANTWQQFQTIKHNPKRDDAVAMTSVAASAAAARPRARQVTWIQSDIPTERLKALALGNIICIVATLFTLYVGGLGLTIVQGFAQLSLGLSILNLIDIAFTAKNRKELPKLWTNIGEVFQGPERPQLSSQGEDREQTARRPQEQQAQQQQTQEMQQLSSRDDADGASSSDGSDGRR